MKVITTKFHGTDVIVGLVNGKVNGKSNVFAVYDALRNTSDAIFLANIGMDINRFQFHDLTSCNYDGEDIVTKFPVFLLTNHEKGLSFIGKDIETVPILQNGAECSIEQLEVDRDESLVSQFTIEGVDAEGVKKIVFSVDAYLWTCAVQKSSEATKNEQLVSNEVIKWCLSDASGIEAYWPPEFKEDTSFWTAPLPSKTRRVSPTDELSFAVPKLSSLIREHIFNMDIDVSSLEHTSEFSDELDSLMYLGVFYIPPLDFGEDVSPEEMISQKKNYLYNYLREDMDIAAGQFNGTTVINTSILPITDRVTPYNKIYPFEKIPAEAFYAPYGINDIIGHTEQNDSTTENGKLIFIPRENEERIYNYIKDLLRAELMITTGIFSDCPELYSAEPKLLKDYFKVLIEQALELNYRHAGITSVKSSSVENEEEEVTVNSVFQFGRIIPAVDNPQNPSDFTFKPMFEGDIEDQTFKERVENYINNIPNVGLGAVKLNGFLSTTTTSFTKYLDAIIQLLRWGTEKPTTLCITGAEENGKPVYWDIASCASKLFNGNLQTLEKICPEGSDCNTYIAGVLTLKTNKLSDEVRKMITDEFSLLNGDIPEQLTIGAVIYDAYKSEDDGEIEIYKFFDIFAFRELIASGYKVNDVTLDNTVEPMQISIDTDEAFIYDNLSDVQNFFDDFNITIEYTAPEIQTILDAHGYKKKLNVATVIGSLLSEDSDASKKIISDAIGIANGETVMAPRLGVPECAALYYVLPKLIYINQESNHPEDVINAIPTAPSRFKSTEFHDILKKLANNKAAGSHLNIFRVVQDGDTVMYSGAMSHKVRDVKTFIIFVFAENEFKEYREKYAQTWGYKTEECFILQDVTLADIVQGSNMTYNSLYSKFKKGDFGVPDARLKYVAATKSTSLKI